ncbi:MAG: pilus assembly protein TadG-related protein [Planctomycetota bacterium]|jgi:hypothetical protein
MKTRHQFIEDPCSPDRSGQIGTGNPLAFAVHRLKDQRGVSAIIIAIVLAVLIGFAALAIDIGYLYATRNELQNVADAAALAAAGQLGFIYLQMTSSEQEDYVYDPNDLEDQNIVDSAQAVGTANMAGGENVSILEDEVQVGIWEMTDRLFTETPNQPNAVRVTTRRDDTVITGKVILFFAKILGIDEAAVTAKATAALTPPASVPEGELKMPIGLSERCYDVLTACPCNKPLELSPTRDSCAGWHNFFDDINADAMKKKLLGFIAAHPESYPDETCEGDPPFSGSDWLKEKFGWSAADVQQALLDLPNPEAPATPPASEADAFEFQGGAIAALFNGGYLVWENAVDEDGVVTCKNCVPVLEDPSDPENSPQKVEGDPAHPAPIIALFDYFRFRDCDTDDSRWETTIPIYDDGEEGGPCENPNTVLDVNGFDKIDVLTVEPPPSKLLQVERECVMRVISGRGQAGEGTLVGSIPNLVE